MYRHRCPHCNTTRVHELLGRDGPINHCRCVKCGQMFSRKTGGGASYWQRHRMVEEMKIDIQHKDAETANRILGLIDAGHVELARTEIGALPFGTALSTLSLIVIHLAREVRRLEKDLTGDGR